MSITRLTSKLSTPRKADARLVLPFESRNRSRLRAELPGGEAVGVMLERGQMLRGGDQLLAEDGRVIEIVAADEIVSVVRSAEGSSLLRAAYHLGNRHVPLQIGADWLRYLHDHVLDDMVIGLGFEVRVERAPFEPEAGAYSNASAAQGHAHAHDAHGHHHDH